MSAAIPAGPYTVEFKGALAKTDVSLMTGTDGGINERHDHRVPRWRGRDKIVLTYDWQSTDEFGLRRHLGQVEAALWALSNIDNVTVTDGDPSGWVVEFKDRWREPMCRP